MDDLSLSCCHHLLVCNPPCLSHPWHLALIIHLCVVWWFREGGMEGFIAGAPSFRHRRRSLVRRVGRPVAQPLRTLAHNLMRSVPPAAPSATASMYINLSHSANPLCSGCTRFHSSHSILASAFACKTSGFSGRPWGFIILSGFGWLMRIKGENLMYQNIFLSKGGSSGHLR